MSSFDDILVHSEELFREGLEALEDKRVVKAFGQFDGGRCPLISAGRSGRNTGQKVS